MNVQRLIQLWLEAHSRATLSTYLLCALAGFGGGAIVCLVRNPELPLPTRVGHKLKLGFLGIVLGGGLFGVFADHSLPIAMLAGMIGPTILTFLLSTGIPTLLRTWLKMATEKESKDD